MRCLYCKNDITTVIQDQDVTIHKCYKCKSFPCVYYSIVNKNWIDLNSYNYNSFPKISDDEYVLSMSFLFTVNISSFMVSYTPCKSEIKLYDQFTLIKTIKSNNITIENCFNKAKTYLVFS